MGERWEMGSDALANSAFAASQTLTKLKGSLQKAEASNSGLRAELADLKASRGRDSMVLRQVRSQLAKVEGELSASQEVSRQALGEQRSLEAQVTGPILSHADVPARTTQAPEHHLHRVTSQLFRGVD
jgi:chromosome segregation ATPase